VKHVVSVNIVERTVFDIKSYTARCTACGWVSKPKELESKAVQAARAHGATCKPK
jgi:hypothetical protein